MQKRIKGLLPSLKEKKRYLAFEIISADSQQISCKSSMTELTSKIKSFMGLINSSAAGIIAVDSNNNKGIIKVSNSCVDQVKSSFIFIRELSSKKVIIKSLGVSGMVHKAKNYI